MGAPVDDATVAEEEFLDALRCALGWGPVDNGSCGRGLHGYGPLYAYCYMVDAIHYCPVRRLGNVGAPIAPCAFEAPPTNVVLSESVSA